MCSSDAYANAYVMPGPARSALPVPAPAQLSANESTLPDRLGGSQGLGGGFGLGGGKRV